jgi:hypothetical protein
MKKIFFLLVIHLLIYFSLKLPYLNLVSLYFPGFIFSIDIILLYKLFKPDKIIIFYAAGLSFIIAGFFSLLQIVNTAILFGDMTYLLLVAYILLAMGELKSKKL